jgi:hypothetical protein
MNDKRSRPAKSRASAGAPDIEKVFGIMSISAIPFVVTMPGH